MRIAGVILIILGFLLSLSIVGAIIGIPLMFIGLLMVIFGGSRKTVITNVVQVSNNGPAPQLSLDQGNGRERPRARGEAPLRAGFDGPQIDGPEQRARYPRLSATPEFELSYDEEFFTDVRSELSGECKRILALARQEGFEIKARPDSLTLRKDDYQELFRSNAAILEFGRTRGYD